MPKNLIILSAISCLLYFGCSKDKQPAPQTGQSSKVKIELVSGGNQTDTIGKLLANPIVVKVTSNGVAQSGYKVEFAGSGCNADDPVSSSASADGTIKYYWFLAGDVGSQSLKAIVLDSQNEKIDSITVQSTGLSPGAGWHNAACSLPANLSPSAFCKLSTGRILAAFKSGLRYSDDNGTSWHALKSFGNTHRVSFMT